MGGHCCNSDLTECVYSAEYVEQKRTQLMMLVQVAEYGVLCQILSMFGYDLPVTWLVPEQPDVARRQVMRRMATLPCLESINEYISLLTSE